MKRLLGLFFLLGLSFAPVAWAEDEPSLVMNPGFNATPVLTTENLGSFFTFDFQGNYIFAKPTGSTSQIIKVSPSGEINALVDRVSQPVLGLSFHEGLVYVVFRGRIDVLSSGRLRDIIAGLPAFGDYGNTSVWFGPDNKMYFGVGSATNSGIVGSDNAWLPKNPSIHDLICPNLKINQVNIETDNFLTAKKDDKAKTGAFMPFNTETYTETPTGSKLCSATIMRANPDGSNLEIVATGLHNIKGLSFDNENRIFALEGAIENRGVRPGQNGKDALYEINKGWYGWPDYSAGQKLDNPIIQTGDEPPRPLAIFDPGHLNHFVVSPFDGGIGFADFDGAKIIGMNFDSGKLFDVAALSPGFHVDEIKIGPDESLYALVSNSKKSELWKIEENPRVITSLSTTTDTFGLPLQWAVSLSITVIGLLASYVVFASRRKYGGV